MSNDPRGCFEELVRQWQAASETSDNLGELITGMEPSDDWAHELFDTGSYTFLALGKRYELTLNVKEVT